VIYGLFELFFSCLDFQRNTCFLLDCGTEVKNPSCWPTCNLLWNSSTIYIMKACMGSSMHSVLLILKPINLWLFVLQAVATKRLSLYSRLQALRQGIWILKTTIINTNKLYIQEASRAIDNPVECIGSFSRTCMCNQTMVLRISFTTMANSASIFSIVGFHIRNQCFCWEVTWR